MRAIKLMAKRTIELFVVDEIAAICGQHPLEQIADSSGYAVGGVAVQMRAARGPVRIQRIVYAFKGVNPPTTSLGTIEFGNVCSIVGR